MRSRRLWLIGFAALLLFSCSKSKDEIPVAKVNDRVITLAKFEDAYLKVDPRFLPEGEGFEKLRNFLDVLVEKEIMAIKADELGYDKDEGVQTGLEHFKRLGLQAAYLKFRVADKVEITEKMLRDYYDRLGTTISMKQILIDTKEEGEHVRKLLDEGSDFESVCKQYSKGPDAEDGGKIMTAAFGRFPPHMQDELFNQPVGGITKPLESPYGYFVIKVVKIDKAKPRQPFEKMKEDLEAIVRSLEERRFMDQRSEEMRQRAGVEWYPENMRIFFEALPPDRPLTNPPRRDEEVYPLLKFDEADLDKALVSYKDKVITIRDYSDIYDRKNFFERPRRENRLAGIKGRIMEVVMNELVADEMRHSKIEEQPELQDLLRRKKEELMVTRMYDELILRKVVVTNNEVNNYYNDNLELYKMPEQRRFGVILTGDETTAKEAYSKLEEGMQVGQVALLYSIDEQTRRKRGETDLLRRGGQPEIDDVGFELAKVGDISEPFETSRGWVVLKLVELVPGRTRSLEEVRDAVESDIRTLKSDSRLKELISEWKEDLSIDIYEKNLRKTDVHERKTKEPS